MWFKHRFRSGRLLVWMRRCWHNLSEAIHNCMLVLFANFRDPRRGSQKTLKIFQSAKNPFAKRRFICASVPRLRKPFFAAQSRCFRCTAQQNQACVICAAHSRPGFRFGGQNTLLGGQHFQKCMVEQIFLGKKLKGEEKRFLGKLPPNSPLWLRPFVAGLVKDNKPKS